MTEYTMADHDRMAGATAGATAAGAADGRTDWDATTTTGTTTGTTGGGTESIGQLVSRVTDDLTTLMRQEIELAKAEVTTEAKKAGKGAGMLGGAGYAGHLTVLFLSFAAWWGLAAVMPVGWAALIVAVIWGLIAAVLAVRGRSELRQVRPKPERTIDTIREVPTALKG